jgi:D-threo-aldose 1-dehydrogenase
MQTLPLAHTGRTTTRLGFGCSSVLGAMNRKDSLAMLEAAYDAGIRHFDVAPSYGFGEAEACVGEFLARHPDELTVTTKFGIPAEEKSWKSAVRQAARPVLKMLPGIKARLQRAASAAAVMHVDAPPIAFTASNAQKSLERSLQALRVPRIDLFLLHEATAKDLQDSQLLQYLQSAVEGGKIGGFGVGSEARKIEALQAERPEYCPVLQYEWSVLDPLIMPGSSFRIHHRSLTDNFRALHQALLADAPRAMRWSDHVGANLQDARVLGGLMLKASLTANPGSLVLFSSKRPEHIRSNVAVANDSATEQQALRLYALVRSEVAGPAGAPASADVGAGA